MVLPLAPLQSVDAVNIFDADDNASLLASDAYVVDAVSEPGRVVLTNGGAAPSAPSRAANGIEIQFTAGYGSNASDVPQAIRQALLMLVAHWYERREPVTLGETSVRVPETASSLLSPYKMVRL